MKIIIKATNFKLSRGLEDYIEEKINSLEKFAEVFQSKNYYDGFLRKGKPRIEVCIEIGKTTQHHQKGDVFRAEAQVRFPGKSIRVESEREDLKLAITEVKDELQREFKKYKSKVEAVTKRKTRILKKSLRLSSLTRFKKRKGGRT